MMYIRSASSLACHYLEDNFLCLLMVTIHVSESNHKSIVMTS